MHAGAGGWCGSTGSPERSRPSSTIQLNRIDPKTDRVTRYRHNPNDPKSLPSNQLSSAVEEDGSGRLWFSANGEGLIRFDPETETFTSYRHDPANVSSLSDNTISSSGLLVSQDGALWVGTNNNGLNRFDPTTETFTRFNLTLDSAVPAQAAVSHLYEDSRGYIWGGLFSLSERKYTALFRLDPKTASVETYRHDPDDAHSFFPPRFIRVLHERAQEPGVLWIAAWGVLSRLDTRTGQFKHYWERNGLKDQILYGMLEDEEGRLWMSANGSLSMFDPDTETFRNYDFSDGLQASEFNDFFLFQEPTHGRDVLRGCQRHHRLFP